MLPGEVHDLRHLHLGNLVGIDTANADPLLVDMQHNARCLVTRLIEKPFQNIDDEVHRCVIVVQQQNFVKTGPLCFRSRFGDDAGFHVAIIAEAPIFRHGQTAFESRDRFTQNRKAVLLFRDKDIAAGSGGEGL